MNRKYKQIGGVFCWLVMLLSVGAGPVNLRFTQTAEIPKVGIVLPILQGSRANPLKPPKVIQRRWQQGSRTWVESCSDAWALWQERQFVGCWVDSKGNTLQLLRMQKVLPSTLPADRLMTRAGFDQLIGDVRYDIVPESEEARLVEWMEDYCGSRAEGPAKTVAVNASRLASLVQIPLRDELIYAYAFRLNLRYPGQAKAEPGWFALILTLAEYPTSDTPRWIREGLLSGIKTTGYFDGTRANSVRKNRSRATPQGVKETPERQRAKASIEAMDTWWFMDSPNYILLSDNDSAEQFASELLQEMERLRPFFHHVLGLGSAVQAEVGTVRLFEQVSDFITYIQSDGGVGMNPQHVAGIFSPMRRELVIRSTRAVGSNREGSVRDVLKHEGFHQYVFLAFPETSPSIWINEGFAEFFANSDVRPRSTVLEVGESRVHAQTLERLVRQPDVNWAERLERFFALEPQGFYRQPQPHYALAWGVVYYLLRGAPLERGQPYREVLPTYWTTFAETGDAHAATQVAFQNVNFRAFSADFVAFWKNTRARQEALRKAWR